MKWEYFSFIHQSRKYTAAVCPLSFARRNAELSHAEGFTTKSQIVLYPIHLIRLLSPNYFYVAGEIALQEHDKRDATTTNQHC